MLDYKDLDRYISTNYYAEPSYSAFSLPLNYVQQDSEYCAYEKMPEQEIIIELDESFSDTVLKLIDERGLKDSDVYNSINMDRRLFSKLRNNDYNPSKQTAISLCIGLKLDLDQCNDLLGKAGYTLSHSNMADVIVEYFIRNRIYDIYTIDEALLHYDQKPLGRY